MEKLEWLYAMGADIDQHIVRYQKESSPLMVLCKQSKCDIEYVEWFLLHGASPEVESTNILRQLLTSWCFIVNNMKVPWLQRLSQIIPSEKFRKMVQFRENGSLLHDIVFLPGILNLELLLVHLDLSHLTAIKGRKRKTPVAKAFKHISRSPTAIRITYVHDVFNYFVTKFPDSELFNKIDVDLFVEYANPPLRARILPKEFHELTEMLMKHQITNR